MPHGLFVNACPRGEDSRTLRLAHVFLEALCGNCPSLTMTEHNLTRMNLRSVDKATLMMKEALCDRRAWEDPYLAPAVAFQRADVVVIAAPYWDLSFPSILKVWVENVYVRNLTFRYENNKPIGLCRGRESVYIATAGSPIGDNDWGARYMRAVLTTLGIPRFTSLCAEALDLEGSDCEAIMERAMAEARDAGITMAKRLEKEMPDRFVRHQR